MKKIIFCLLAFAWFSSSAEVIKPVNNPAKGVGLAEQLSADKDFIKMSALSYNLLQAVEKNKCGALLKKYYKKTITPGEKAMLLGALKMSGEAQLTDMGNSIINCSKNLLNRYPELQQKNREELLAIISDATGNHPVYASGALTGAARAKSCWDLYRAAIMDCFMSYGNNQDAYDACMSAALDMYNACAPS